MGRRLEAHPGLGTFPAINYQLSLALDSSIMSTCLSIVRLYLSRPPHTQADFVC